MSNKIQTKGIHHLGLTVPSVAETGRFFVDILGYEFVAYSGDHEHPYWFIVNT